MLQVKIIAIGRLKEKYLKDACNEYIKRLRRFCDIKVIELDEYKLPDSPSEKEIIKSLDIESESILKNISGFIIPMCIEGKRLSSTEFAERLRRVPVNGYSAASFIIGSSHGLSDKVKSRANLKLSLSEMTFPHQLARVMLLEQIYRCFKINNGEKYHK